jgi:hypothetical protein
MEASRNRTATPFGGVSPIVRLMGIVVPLPTGLGLAEPPQAARKTLLKTSSAKGKSRLMPNSSSNQDSF